MVEKIALIKEQVLEAIENASSLNIIAGGSKEFLGRKITGTPLEMGRYQGIINYEPSELFITVKAGTLLGEIIQVLAERGQMLAFEPPQFTEKTTVGGVVATGLSGPRRAYTGSVRDYVLGIHCINGLGQDLSFGGQVMKNVAGYDLSRVMTGSYGTLGVILDVTFKVMPIPEFELTCFCELSRKDALTKMYELSCKPFPVSASCYDGEKLYLRISGYRDTVKTILTGIGFEEYLNGDQFWRNLRDFRSSFFNTDKNIWRLSLPVTAKPEIGDDQYLIDWGGAQYWIKSDRPANEFFKMAEELGGNATLFKGTGHNENIFQPLQEDMMIIQQGLKRAFDPHSVLNPGKMYAAI